MSIHDHFVGPVGGVLMSLIAFSIVFLVIVGLMLVMMATKMIARAVDSRDKGQGGIVSPQGSYVPPAPPQASAVAPDRNAQDDLELVAAITAALTCAMGRPVAVRSIRPAARFSGGAWRAVAKLDHLEAL